MLNKTSISTHIGNVIGRRVDRERRDCVLNKVFGGGNNLKVDSIFGKKKKKSF